VHERINRRETIRVVDWKQVMTRVKNLSEPEDMDKFPNIKYKFVAVDYKEHECWVSGIIRPLSAALQQLYYDYTCTTESGIKWWDAMESNTKDIDAFPLEFKKRVGYNIETAKMLFLVDMYLVS